MTRQEWLDGLRVGDEGLRPEVAAVYQASGECRVFRVSAVTEGPAGRVIEVEDSHGRKMRFSGRGESVDLVSGETKLWPCLLEDPDGEAPGTSPPVTRRWVSEIQHARATLGDLTRWPRLSELTLAQVVAMVRVVRPDYEPRW